MKKQQIVRISILQSGKIVAILYALIGFLYALLGAVLLLNANSAQERATAFVFLFAPLWITAIGFVFFVVAASIYNGAVKWIGGLEFTVEDVEEEPPVVPPKP